jgi:hypothetical protein
MASRARPGREHGEQQGWGAAVPESIEGSKVTRVAAVRRRTSTRVAAAEWYGGTRITVEKGQHRVHEGDEDRRALRRGGVDRAGRWRGR